jgi:hypothetical protein
MKRRQPPIIKLANLLHEYGSFDAFPVRFFVAAWSRVDPAFVIQANVLRRIHKPK